MPSRFKGLLFLFLSSIIISASSPVIAKLIEIGNDYLVNGRNPISFCNVLFAGSLIACLTLSLLYHKDIKAIRVEKLTAQNWVIILSTAFISGCLSPTLYFFGIKYANIINVILISTLYTPLQLLAGWIFLNEKPNRLMLTAAALTTLGVVLMIFLQYWWISLPPSAVWDMDNGPLHAFLISIPYVGELCVFIAVFLRTISSLINFQAVNVLSVGIFNTFSMFFGIIFFFSITVALFGWEHFADLFSPFLWQWMLVYGGIVVALSIYFKFLGIRYANMAEVAISQSIYPVASIFFAYIILGTIPGKAQLIGGSIIFIGIGLALKSKIIKKYKC
ncbi:EamA family transporter [Legionella israelensis]|nr:EamA family transporter [Legionella israelensis]